MKKYRYISIVLLCLFLLSLGLFFKQKGEFKRMESALFGTAVGFRIVDYYRVSSLEEALNYAIQEEVLVIDHNGSSDIKEELKRVQSAYQELHSYYYPYYYAETDLDFKHEKSLFMVLDRFQTFYNNFVQPNKHGTNEDDEIENQYLLPLSDESLEGFKIIQSIINEIKNILDETDQYMELDNRRKFMKEIVEKNEIYTHTEKVQRDVRRITQIIRMLPD